MEQVEHQVKPGQPVSASWVHQPGPDNAGGNEGDGHWEEEYAAKNGLPFEPLIQDDREAQPNHQAADDKEHREHTGIAYVDGEARIVKK